MIKSSEVKSWLYHVSSTLKLNETTKAHLSKKAIENFYSLSQRGFFPELLMTRRYRSGLLYIARVR